MDFPARVTESISVATEMSEAVGETVLEAYLSNNSRDLLLLLESEQQVINAIPNFNLLKSLASHAVTITAKENSVDFVSRFFAPNMGIPEDHVTGSAHTTLIPFWASRLNKEEMTAKQLSKREGTLYCKNSGDRVKISGKAVLYLQGEIFCT